MIHKTRTLLIIITIIIGTVISGCTTSPIAGGSSGTEVSAVIGQGLTRDGLPAINALVRLRPDNFLADSGASEFYRATHTILDTVTGADGLFHFKDLLPDKYTIEIIYEDTLASEVSCTIIDNQTRAEIPPVRVKQLAKLHGNARINNDGTGSITVQVYGIDRKARFENDGNFSLEVPHGTRTFSFAAFELEDTMHSRAFDNMEISLSLYPGEQRNAGMIKLQPRHRRPPFKDRTFSGTQEKKDSTFKDTKY